MTETGNRVNYRVTFAVLSVGVASYALLQSLILPVLPTIQHSLHTSQDTVTWALTAYLLSSAVFTPIFGRIGDMVGKKKMLVVTLAALAVGSLLAALASSIGVLIVARVIQGVGGGLLPLTFGIIRDEFPADKVRGAVGMTAALTAVGAGVGIVLAGPIVDALDYHWLFWIPLLMAVASGVLSWIVIPESRLRTPGRINWSAAALLSLWLVALLVAVSEGPTWGWVSGRIIVLFVLSAAIAVAWIRVELHSSMPLIDMRMMRLPAVWTTNLAAFLFGVGMFASFAFVPEFVQTSPSAGYGFGASVTKSGLFLFPLTAAMFAFGMVSGRLSQRVGSKIVLTMGSAVCLVPFLMMAYANDQQWEIFVATFVLGIGFGLAYSAMSNLIVEAVPQEQTGVASGMNANIRTIGGSIGAAIMASIVTSGVAANAVPKKAGYTHGFLVLTATGVLATIASVLVPSRRPHEGEPLPAGDGPHAELGILAAGTLTGSEPE